MSDELVDTSMDEALLALHLILPSVLRILARQSPEQRRELEETLAYAIERCGSGFLPAATPGAVKILSIWMDSVAAQNDTKLNA